MYVLNHGAQHTEKFSVETVTRDSLPLASTMDGVLNVSSSFHHESTAHGAQPLMELNRSTARPLDRSTARPLDRSTAQPLDRSTDRSTARPINRSTAYSPSLPRWAALQHVHVERRPAVPARGRSGERAPFHHHAGHPTSHLLARTR